MTGDHFESQMIRMYDIFGKQSYPKARLDSIWNACKVLPNESFTWIVDQFIDTSKTAPLPTEFKKLAYHEKKKLGLEVKEPETKPYLEAICRDCGDSGNLFIERKDEFESWAKFHRGVIRCECVVGRARPISQGPIWNSQIEKSYMKEPMYKGQNFERQIAHIEKQKAGLLKMLNGGTSSQRGGKELKPLFGNFGEKDPNDAA